MTAVARAFREGLVALRPEILARAKGMVRGHADAEDLAQQALLRALVYEPAFAPGTNLRAWVHKILHSLVVNWARRRRLKDLAFEELEHLAELKVLVPVGFSPGTARVLGELYPPFRAAVELVDLKGFTYAEAAAALRIPVGTVMSRLHRGRAALRARLANPEGAP